jgi:hypothetical protein
MPTKKRQTMGKMTRERELRERRELKQEKKDARKQAAAERLLAGPDAQLESDNPDALGEAADEADASEATAD